eukprot:COSAG05_NODE_937_length_6525_cov_6.136632_4_plen_64_part_00
MEVVFETNIHARMCMNEKVVSLSLLRWLRLSTRREERDTNQTCISDIYGLNRIFDMYAINAIS